MSYAISKDKPVLVAGASGFVGSHTVRLLVNNGRKVRVMVRKTSKLDALQGLPVEICYGDVLDPDSIRQALEGCSSVFYSVVDPRFWLTDVTPIYRNNVEGLINAMDVALECGVERFIFTSTMGTLGINPGGVVTEDIAFNWHDRATPYIEARLEAENIFLKYCREKGLPGVALCIANTYGPEDYQPTPHNEMLWKIASGEVRVMLGGGAPPVDIRDAAQAALLAEEYGKVGERYIIANEYIDNKDFYGLATAATGRPPVRLISLAAIYPIAWIAEKFFTLFGIKDQIFGTAAIELSGIFQQMDNSKARNELHWSPRPIEETVRDAIAWFSENRKQGN